MVCISLLISWKSSLSVDKACYILLLKYIQVIGLDKQESYACTTGSDRGCERKGCEAETTESVQGGGGDWGSRGIVLGKCLKLRFSEVGFLAFCYQVSVLLRLLFQYSGSTEPS